jgi:hypothetical protein
VFSLATPESPRPIATIITRGFDLYGVRVQGDRLLLAKGFDGLGIVDVSDPADPEFIGLIPTSGAAADADLEMGLAVVTGGNSAISTVATGTIPTAGAVRTLTRATAISAVEAQGNRTYVTTVLPNEFVVLDTTNPLAPIVLGSVTLYSANAEDIAVRDGYAYVAEYGGLQVYDVSNPSAPRHVGGDASQTGLHTVALGPDVVYVGGGSHFLVYDVSTPATPAIAGMIHFPGGQPQGIAFDGSVIVQATGAYGVVTFDATDAIEPKQRARVDMWQVFDVALQPPFALVTHFTADGVSDALRVLDYSVLAAPTVVASVPMPGSVDGVEVRGTRGYVSSVVNGVHVVDFGNPARSKLIGTIPIESNIEDLDADDAYVYVAGGWPTGTLDVLRVSQMDLP